MVYRTEDALGELLREIERHSSSVRFDAMANIVAVHCQSEGKQSHYQKHFIVMNEFLSVVKTSFMTLAWLIREYSCPEIWGGTARVQLCR